LGQALANGNENALGLSLDFDPGELTYLNASLGSGASSATLVVNSNSAASGQLGLLLGLPTATAFVPGTQEVVRVTFALAAVTSPTSTAITFGDLPTVRELADTNAVVLPVTFSGALVSIGPAAFEADVSPRPNGDEALTAADWVQLGRFVAGLDSPTSPSEFQRADCAPRATLGDGYILVNDWVQAGRYAAGLDPRTVAGGPSVPGPLAALASLKIRERPGSPASLVSVENAILANGQTASVAVDLRAQGRENALSFSLTFDPALLSYKGTSLGADASGATLLVNSSQAASGRLGYALALGAGKSFASGARELVRATFQASGSATGTVSTALSDQPVTRAISDATANFVAASYVDGTIGVNPAPALTITHSDQNVVLSWPLWAKNFALQEADGSRMPSLVWSNVATSIFTNGSQSQAIVPVSMTTKYYRLQNQ
jgi:hypothetical protein